MAYRNKGTMATIGRSAAVAQLPLGVKLTGRVAWPGRLNVIVGDPR
jgi:NADH dehydrogenase FAD-containing subunit